MDKIITAKTAALQNLTHRVASSRTRQRLGMRLPSAAFAQILSGRPSFAGFALVRINGQAHKSSCDFTRPGCDFYSSPVSGCYPACDAQTEAAAFKYLAVTGISSEKRIENA